MHAHLAKENIMNAVDFAVGSVIAVCMTIGFVRLSSGRSLIVTFVPGVVISLLVLFWMYLQHTEFPAADAFVPFFFGALVVQFLHFAEEFWTDFRTFFPNLYGGEAYSDRMFVTFNMAAYAVFATCCLLAFYADAHYLLMPVLFFIIYGAIGNAVSHTVWSVSARAYRPGLITAQAYWLVGPFVLYRLIGDAAVTAVVTVVVAIVLTVTVTAFTARVPVAQ
jgi:hypothetical protein